MTFNDAKKLGRVLQAKTPFTSKRFMRIFERSVANRDIVFAGKNARNTAEDLIHIYLFERKYREFTSEDILECTQILWGRSNEEWARLKPIVIGMIAKYGVDAPWWLIRDPYVVAEYQIKEDTLMVNFGDFNGAVEKVIGRPVFTHEYSTNRAGLKLEITRCVEAHLRTGKDNMLTAAEKLAALQETIRSSQELFSKMGKTTIQVSLASADDVKRKICLAKKAEESLN